MFTIGKKFLFGNLLFCSCVAAVAIHAMEEPAVVQPGEGIVFLVEIDVCAHIVQGTFAEAQAYIAGLDRTNDVNQQIVQRAEGVLQVFSDAYDIYTHEIANRPFDASAEEIEYSAIIEPNATIIEQVIKMKAHGFEMAKIFIDVLGINYITAHGQSLLHLSAHAGNEQVVAWLLHKLSEQFIGNPIGMTAFVTLLDAQGKAAIAYAHALSVDHGIVQMLSQHSGIITHHALLRYAPSVASAALAERQREERLRRIMPVLYHDNDKDRAILRG